MTGRSLPTRIFHLNPAEDENYTEDSFEAFLVDIEKSLLKALAIAVILAAIGFIIYLTLR
jgi:hypothetical protein